MSINTYARKKWLAEPKLEEPRLESPAGVAPAIAALQFKTGDLALLAAMDSVCLYNGVATFRISCAGLLFAMKTAI